MTIPRNDDNDVEPNVKKKGEITPFHKLFYLFKILGGFLMQDLYGEKSFNCPHCFVFAQQKWNQVIKQSDTIADHSGNPMLNEYYEIEKGAGITIYRDKVMLPNHVLAFCICQSCKKPSLWYKHNLVYPIQNAVEDPNSFMPEEVKVIYDEARSVLDLSPRASAALLRLGLEKLLPYLGAKKDNINQMIKQLVQERKVIGKLQEAMDTLRVVGNDAVHPGLIDLEGRDNRDVSLALFKILNFIVAETLESDETISELYSLIPEGPMKGIKDRENSKKTK